MNLCWQCVPKEFRCDGIKHCWDDTDEMQCQPVDLMETTPPPPAIVHFINGTLIIEPLSIRTAICPDTHFWCPGEDYCLPVYVRCNTVYDCLGHEDEEGCGKYTCPGFYGCRNSRICVHADHVCDGVFQCPERDDELMCDMTCPDNCQCYGHAFVCTGKFAAEQYPDLRYLNADGTGMTLLHVSANRMLIHLSLQHCGISEMDSVDLPNLKSLDLRYNFLTDFTRMSSINPQNTTLTNDSLTQFTTKNMLNLNSLDLSSNFLTEFKSMNMSKLTSLDLSNNSLTDFTTGQMQNLTSLNLSNNFLTDFTSVNMSKLASLDLSGNSLANFSTQQMQNLTSLNVSHNSLTKFTCENVPRLIHLSLSHNSLIKFTKKQLPNLRSLDLSHNSLTKFSRVNMPNMEHINLSNNRLTVFTMKDLPNLESLDLSHNALTQVLWVEVSDIERLHTLSLSSNKDLPLFSVISEVSFPNLLSVDFSGIDLEEIPDTLFQKFPNARYLNLSDSNIQKVSSKGFKELQQLEVLDLTGCPMTDFSADLFKGLENMETIQADNYRLCCPGILPEGFSYAKCRASDGEISSCAALLRADIFRLFLTVYCGLALVGNLASFLFRICSKQNEKKRLGFDVFVTHLCVSDFLMGVYLAIIGVADRWYYGTYAWNDREWTHSGACQLAGFLSFVSSEVSSFLVCFITLERFLCVHFPHRDFNFTGRSANVASVAAWVVGVGLASVPLLHFTDHWQFYSQTGICIPLPITNKTFPGSDYSFYVIIAINFVLFLLVAVGQLLIFWSYHTQSKAVRSSSKRAKDMAIARRLLAVAMSDFLCWFPLGLLGIMAKSGVPIPGEFNVIMAIFVLPFNSAVNPLLYTLPVVREQRRQTKKKNREKAQVTNRKNRVEEVSSSSAEKHQTDTVQTENFTEEEARQLLVKFLQDRRVTPEHMKLHLGRSTGQSQPDKLHDEDFTAEEALQLFAKFLQDGRLTLEQVQSHLISSSSN